MTLINNNGFTDAHGQSVKPGDTVYYANRSTNATLMDADQDGEATIQLDDGKLLFVKWHRLIKVSNK